MKKFSLIISFLILLAACAWRLYDLMPQENTRVQGYSIEAVQNYIKRISDHPHYVGTQAHKEVQSYLVDELEAMGLEVETQRGYSMGSWGNFSKATNILARFNGTDSSKALLLLSHYDSSPHSSHGASDDALGVSIILEGIKSVIQSGETPKNDIIILFSDAEELGLIGAQLFVNKHPWAKDVGLVLNFEARGSGGPSYMLLETNGGNKNLIESFEKAAVKFPVANSLTYSIYKMLPNDTDLTVFREAANIDGFNFAFIDDHFDYHTVNDRYENLNQNTLQHQISYLIPLMDYYGNTNLNNLKSSEENVYFDFPIFNFVYYPFSWIYPMLIIATLLFFYIFYLGISNRSLSSKGVFKSLFAFFACIAISGGIGYIAWPLLKLIYPQYNDILQGFPYNGHYYIAAFTALSFTLCFFIYSKIKNVQIAELVIVPIGFWLLICLGVAFYLRGASFFIIPVYATLCSLWMLVKSNKKRPIIGYLVALCIPALWIFAPLIQMFPVGLGLKLIGSSTILSVLLFGLLLPVFGYYNNKKHFAILGLSITGLFFIAAHLQASPTKERPHPTSLVYQLNLDSHKAYWATYNKHLDPWIEQYIQDSNNGLKLSGELTSKYASVYTHITAAPIKSIKGPTIRVEKDTIIHDRRKLKIHISHNRKVDRLEVITTAAKISNCTVNNVPVPLNYLFRRSDRLFTHYISGNESTTIELECSPQDQLSFDFYEASYDLLTHHLFSIPERPENAIPMPFVLNDAILTKKTLNL